MISREQAEKYSPARRRPALEQSRADDGHLIGRDPRQMTIAELNSASSRRAAASGVSPEAVIREVPPDQIRGAH